jgi:hypothetical protein
MKETDATTTEEGQAGPHALIANHSKPYHLTMPDIFYVSSSLRIPETMRYPTSVTDPRHEFLEKYSRMHLPEFFYERHVLKLHDYIHASDANCRKMGHRLFGERHNSLQVLKTIGRKWKEAKERMLNEAVSMICFQFWCIANQLVFERMHADESLPRFIYITLCLLDIRRKEDIDIDAKTHPWLDYWEEARMNKFNEFVFRVMRYEGLKDANDWCDDNTSKTRTTYMTSRKFTMMDIENLHEYFGLDAPIPLIIGKEKFKRNSTLAWLQRDKQKIRSNDKTKDAKIPEAWTHNWLSPHQSLFESEYDASGMFRFSPDAPESIRVLQQLIRFVPKSSHITIGKRVRGNGINSIRDMSFPVNAKQAENKNRAMLALAGPDNLYKVRLGKPDDNSKHPTRERFIRMRPIPPIPLLRHDHFGPFFLTVRSLLMVFKDQPGVVLRYAVNEKELKEMLPNAKHYRMFITVAATKQKNGQPTFHCRDPQQPQQRVAHLSTIQERQLNRLCSNTAKMTLAELFEALFYVGKDECSVFKTLLSCWRERRFAEEIKYEQDAPSLTALCDTFLDCKKLHHSYQPKPEERKIVEYLEQFLKDWRRDTLIRQKEIVDAGEKMATRLRNLDDMSWKSLRLLMANRFGAGWNGYDSCSDLAQILVEEWIEATDTRFIHRVLQQAQVCYRKDERSSWISFAASPNNYGHQLSNFIQGCLAACYTAGNNRQVVRWQQKNGTVNDFETPDDTPASTDLSPEFLSNCNEFKMNLSMVEIHGQQTWLESKAMDLATFYNEFVRRHLFDPIFLPMFEHVRMFCPRPGPRFADGRYWKPNPIWMAPENKHLRVMKAAAKKLLSRPGIDQEIIQGSFMQNVPPLDAMMVFFGSLGQLAQKQLTPGVELLMESIKERTCDTLRQGKLLSYFSDRIHIKSSYPAPQLTDERFHDDDADDHDDDVKRLNAPPVRLALMPPATDNIPPPVKSEPSDDVEFDAETAIEQVMGEEVVRVKKES